MAMSKVKLYKVACSDRNRTGRLGRYRFYQGVSLWLTERRAKDCLVTAGRKLGDADSFVPPFYDIQEFMVPFHRKHQDEQAYFDQKWKWPYKPISESNTKARVPKEIVAQDPIEEVVEPVVEEVVEQVIEPEPEPVLLVYGELQRLREGAGLSRTDVALELNVSQATIQNWERNGIPTARLKDVTKVARGWEQGEVNAETD